MSIGGTDVVLLAPAQECIGDIILRACRRHWPKERCFFQDALVENQVYPLDDPWVWRSGTASKEFFVYQNQRAVESWEKEGAAPTNANTMFYFLVGDPCPANAGLVEVSLVCDKLTADVKKLVADLEAAFLLSIAGSPREAA